MLYAAYAGNLDPDRMAERAPRSPVRGSGWLPGWRLTFGGEEHGWDGPLPTVVECPERPDSAVYVVLYEVAPGDEHLLDAWEGVSMGLFRRLTVRVQTLDGSVPAFLYVLDAYEGGLPSALTVGLVADAAEKGGAPADYVAELRARPCRSVG
ncbi:gamma-glutamylcyclotransferase [Aquipuribacter nitratireducens]|uniref:Gamma-glutamylcyclotransferase n=1 Tax=Aquipuribacter nitratireducens TaxID=650104 RepID=A0ABW0GK70_9MICO